MLRSLESHRGVMPVSASDGESGVLRIFFLMMNAGQFAIWSWQTSGFFGGRRVPDLECPSVRWKLVDPGFMWR